MSGSVVIRLRPSLSREDAHNDGTVFFAFCRETPRPDLRELFIRHYDSIRAGQEVLAGTGVTVTVIGPAGFEGSAAILAKPKCINVITIGRHGRADLFLSGEPTMSLRQGAVIVYPEVEGEGVRFRVLDLRALRPLEDERGRQFEALEAEGPIFLRSGAHTLFVFPDAQARCPGRSRPKPPGKRCRSASVSRRPCSSPTAVERGDAWALDCGTEGHSMLMRP